MKGWITLHGADEVDVAIRVSEVKAVYPVGEHTAIDVGGRIYYAVETVDEVLDLISEAENSSLYRKLKEAKATCAGIRTLYEGHCDDSCPYWTGEKAWMCEALAHSYPEDWELEKIPEEYR